MPDFDIDAALREPEPPPLMVPSRHHPEYEVVDIGIINSHYFRGCGAGRFDDVYVGGADTPGEALDDALDQAASSGWDVASVVSPYTPETDAEWSVSVRTDANGSRN